MLRRRTFPYSLAFTLTSALILTACPTDDGPADSSDTDDTGESSDEGSTDDDSTTDDSTTDTDTDTTGGPGGGAFVWTSGIGGAVRYDLEAGTFVNYPQFGILALDAQHYVASVSDEILNPDYRVFDGGGVEVGAVDGSSIWWVTAEHVIYEREGQDYRARFDGSEEAAYERPLSSSGTLAARDRRSILKCEIRPGPINEFWHASVNLSGPDPVTNWEVELPIVGCGTPLQQSLDGSSFWQLDGITVLDQNGTLISTFPLDPEIEFQAAPGPGPNGDDILIVTDQPSGSRGFLVDSQGGTTEIMVPGINLTWAQTDRATGTVVAASSHSLTQPAGLRWANLDGSGDVSLIENEDGFQNLPAYFSAAP